MPVTRAPLDARHGDPPPRRIALQGGSVDYRLFRGRRRTIGMEIDVDGLTVRAPHWVTIREIEAALRERARWIERSLDAWRRRQRDVLPREWKSGARIAYRGHDLALAVFPSRLPDVHSDLLHLTVQHPAAPDEPSIAKFVGEWLKEEAIRLVVPRVAEFAKRVVPMPPPVKLSNARSEWGSCNARGDIRLNWRLVQLPPALADYVVAHEVAHLLELNHSARFWTVVETLLPAYAAHRRALEEWTALLSA